MTKRTGFYLFAAIVAGILALQAADYKGSHAERDEKDIRQLEADWTTAIRNGDFAALDRLLAPDYTLVDSSGKTVSRSQEIDMYRSGDVSFSSFSSNVEKVTIFIGGAVVTGTATVKGKYKKEDISGEYRFVDIVERRKDGWQAVFSQITKVEKEKEKKKEGATPTPRK